MKLVVCLALAVVAAAGAAHAAPAVPRLRAALAPAPAADDARPQAIPSVCDTTKGACQYSFSVGGHTYDFDLQSGCSETGYTGQDQVGHTYTFNMCGRAPQPCLPASWTNTYVYGPAVQTWGSTPQCTPPGPCTNPLNQSASCCTKDCQVLGTGSDIVALMDEGNPATGGLVITHAGVAASESDPYWCDFNPTTGAQYERYASYFVACDRSATKPTGIVVTQNTTNDCHYFLNYSWAGACANNVPPPPPPSTCVHGTVTGGKCVCETGWKGPTCNETSLVCAIGPTCNTCSACCASYGTDTCIACYAAECEPKQTCSSDTSKCTTCSTCCVDWLRSQEECDTCAFEKC